LSAPAVDWRLGVLLAIVGGTLIAALSLKPIPQDPAYHEFADRREIAGIPNFFDVVSNLPFLVIGIAGVGTCGRCPAGAVRQAWRVLFIGVGLVSLGSAYYHWNPTDQTLLWDRLPMTVGFMGLFVALVGEHLGSLPAAVSLVPALCVGIGSVLYWHWTDDLRLYGWVQFMPLLAVPVMMCLWRSRWSHRWLLLVALGWYALAKLAESYDVAVFRCAQGMISGHTLKHLLSAAGCATLVVMVGKRGALDRNVATSLPG